MISVSRIKKYYNKGKRNQVTAIDNTSLQLGEKGLVSILGNSGCGKTTLLNMIGGLDKPDSGKIIVNGKKMNGVFSSRTDNIRNANIGYIFQNYNLLNDRTVFDNVAIVLKMLGVRNKQKLTESVHYALEMVGLYRYRNRPAGALSGGERQRVGIARAIVKNPDIIIADEPTGNLDSGNSLEVMNIIKTISKDKLVILVTHERELAEFYSDRIIEIVDGSVVSDRLNEHDDSLDYRIDNKLYLKDFPESQEVSAGSVNLRYFSDGSQAPSVTLVMRNGNLYISCEDRKIEIVDRDSAIQLVDDHYKALTLDEAESKKVDFSKLGTEKKKKYHSIYNIFNLFWNGVKTVFSYPKMKKLLLIGFVVAAAGILFSMCSIFGITNVTDDEFVNVNKNYVLLKNTGNNVRMYTEALGVEGVNYVLPGDSLLSLSFPYSELLYQSSSASDRHSASLTGWSMLDESMLVYGRMPESNNELVIDKLILEEVIKNGSAKMMGIRNAEEYLGRPVVVSESMDDFTIVGITDELSPCIYASDYMLPRILMNSTSSGYYDGMVVNDLAGIETSGGYNDEDNNAQINALENAKGEITIKKGTWPANDYEVIVPYDMRYEYKIGKKISGRVNGREIIVVGYYTSSDKDSELFTNFNTYFYKWLASTNNLTICSQDRDYVMSYYQEQNADVEDIYFRAKTEYEAEIKETVDTTIKVATVFFVISLLEILLMLRSSFLSRVKEVGILRAIGLKKGDVYKMFLGEILAITAITAPIGFYIMGKVVSALSQVEYFGQKFLLNINVVLLSALIVVVFNVIIGLIPVFTTLVKTPAAILARTDVD